MHIQLQAALRPAHVAQHQLLRDATSAVRSQLAAEQTKLRDAHHRAISLEMELSDTKEECKALKQENAVLKKERNLLESQLASRESLAASIGAVRLTRRQQQTTPWLRQRPMKQRAGS